MNPFQAPDDARMAGEVAPGPKPEDVDATFVGPGPEAEAWRVSVTEDRLYFTKGEGQQSVTLDRRTFADDVNIGVLTPSRVALVLKANQRLVVTLPRDALEHIYAWLGADAESFRRRILRAGWGSTLVVGVLFLVPLGSTYGLSQYLAWVSGAVLVTAGLMSRFTGQAVALLLRALGWVLLSAGFVYGVAQGDSSPWVLAVAFLLSWGVVRYVRLFRFFSGSAGPKAE